MRRWLKSHKFFLSIPLLYVMPLPMLIFRDDIDASRFGFLYGQVLAYYIVIGTIVWFIHRKVTNKKRAKSNDGVGVY